MFQVHLEHGKCFHNSVWNRELERHPAGHHQPARGEEPGDHDGGDGDDIDGGNGIPDICLFFTQLQFEANNFDT